MLGIWTTNAANLILLGRISLQRGDLTLARQGFEAVLELAPEGDLSRPARLGLEAVRRIETGEITLQDLLDQLPKEEQDATAGAVGGR